MQHYHRVRRQVEFHLVFDFDALLAWLDGLLFEVVLVIRLTCECGFGCHLEKKGEGRFELLKETHPGIYGLLDVCKNNGVTMREAIDWVNEHGNLHIRY